MQVKNVSEYSRNVIENIEQEFSDENTQLCETKKVELTAEKLQKRNYLAIEDGKQIAAIFRVEANMSDPCIGILNDFRINTLFTGSKKSLFEKVTDYCSAQEKGWRTLSWQPYKARCVMELFESFGAKNIDPIPVNLMYFQLKV